MHLAGWIFSFLTCLFVSSIDLKCLSEKELLKISIKNLKKYYNLLNFIIIIFVNIYLTTVFVNNLLYMINLLCFLCIYICSITDIFCKNIFFNIIILFSLPILLFNIYGNYLKVSVLGLISGMLLYGIIYILSRLIYGTEVFGIGDIYVISLIGFSTDYYTVFHIGLYTFIVAGIFYFIKFLFVRDFKKFKYEEIPLVPFVLFSYLILIYF